MDFDFSSIDKLCDLLGTLSVDSAAESDSSAQNFFHCTSEINGHTLRSELLCDFNNIVHLDVTVVLDVLYLLSGSGSFLKGFDDEGSSGR